MTSPYRDRGYAERACANCGQRFRPHYPLCVYCSDHCRDAAKSRMARERRERRFDDVEHPPCVMCGAEVTRGNRGLKAWLERRTCSRECYTELARRNSLYIPMTQISEVDWHNAFAAHNLALPERGIYLKLLPDENRTLGGVAG